ncbi:hypothetical protein ACFSE1_16245 [Rhizobium helianthi]|uniref:Uncharacterized protein n=1 Tax=Rhizobium helianthi TaxID=1132695 RepID=A0ABW4M799_9HYPH
MMMKFLHTLIQEADIVSTDDDVYATGTYADGLFYLTRQGVDAERCERKRLSYGRDFRAAAHLLEHPTVLG